MRDSDSFMDAAADFLYVIEYNRECERLESILDALEDK